MNKASQAQEPSMEEILASIRRIISDDDPNAQPSPGVLASVHAGEAPMSAPMANGAADEAEDGEDEPAPRPMPAEDAADDADGADEVVELTSEMKAPEPPETEPAGPIPVEAKAEQPARQPDRLIVEPFEGDVVFEDRSGASAEAAGASRAAEAEALVRERLLSPNADAVVSHSFANLANLIMSKDARTLEDLVREMLRPMLKAWLDDNLPPLVERLVREEIERVSRGR